MCLSRKQMSQICTLRGYVIENSHQPDTRTFIFIIFIHRRLINKKFRKYLVTTSATISGHEIRLAFSDRITEMPFGGMPSIVPWI